MTELEVITTAAGGIITITLILAWAGAHRGMFEWSASFKVVPQAKRGPAPAEPAAEPVTQPVPLTETRSAA